MKNLTELKGNWNEIKGKLKQKFAMLTDSDLLFVAGLTSHPVCLLLTINHYL